MNKASRCVALGGVALVLFMHHFGSAFAAEESAHETARVAVVPVLIARADKPSPSSIFEAVAAAARFRSELSIMSEEETFVAASAELSDRVLDCGPDARCVARELTVLGVRLGLVVVVNLDLEPPLLGLQLIDCTSARVVAESIDRLEKKSELGVRLRERAAKLFDDAGHPVRARLVVHATPPEAKLEVGGGVPPADKLTPNAFLLAPGKYRVRAMLDGFEDASAEVEVVLGSERAVDLVLVRNTPIYESAWFWIAAGAAAAGITAGVFFATRPTDHYVCVPLGGVDCAR